MRTQRNLDTSGNLTMFPLRASPPKISPLVKIAKHGFPNLNLPKDVYTWRLKNLLNLARGLPNILAAEKAKIPYFWGSLYLTVLRPKMDVTELLKEWSDLKDPPYDFYNWISLKGVPCTQTHLGLVSTRVVTTVGVNFIVDAFQDAVELEIMRFHGFGTGSTAEAVGDTDLVTELTTEYTTNNTRPTGTLTEGASANIFRTVGTVTVDEVPAAALREHGIFSVATVGSGVLLDRSVYAAITLGSGDGLQATYDLTLTAGS